MKQAIALVWLSACLAAQSFHVGAMVPWGAASLPLPHDVATVTSRVTVSVERQGVEALDAFAGRRPEGMSLYLVTVCGSGSGPLRTSPGHVRQAIAESGISIATEMITRQTLRRTRSKGMSYLARGGQLLELVGPGVLAATGSGAIRLRPRELAGLALLVTGGRVVADVGREERDRAREPIAAGEIWFWQLPKLIDLSDGACSDTVQALGSYLPGRPKAFSILMGGMN